MARSPAAVLDVLGRISRLAGPPRPGLVPQSGDPEHPDRWVRPEEAEDARLTSVRVPPIRLKNKDQIKKVETLIQQHAPMVSKRISEIRELTKADAQRLGMTPTAIAGYQHNTGILFLGVGVLRLHNSKPSKFETAIVHEMAHATWDDLSTSEQRDWTDHWRDEIRNSKLIIYGLEDPQESFAEVIAQVRRSDSTTVRAYFEKKGLVRALGFLDSRGLI